MARPLEFRPHYANDFVRLLVELHGAADDVRVAAKNRLPSVIRQNNFAIGVGLIFFGRKDTAQQRLGFEHIEPLPGYAGATQAQRPGACGVIKIIFSLDGGRSESLLVIADKRIVRRGNHDALEVQLFVARANGHQSLGMLYPVRVQEQPIDHAEDGGVCTDAQGKRQNGHRGKAGTLHEHADGVAKVLPECSHLAASTTYEKEVS